MTTTTVRFVGSQNQAKALFNDSDCHSYKRLSGNSRRGTYALEVREGSALLRRLAR